MTLYDSRSSLRATMEKQAFKAAHQVPNHVLHHHPVHTTAIQQPASHLTSVS